ncbi:hypothetical protein D1632_10685 [Chryseobacterium nematophagum]|uniref:Uncharacterized protein n=1 Tax=Chryseobacterium nematophagum TaxID=2305228 RepID=A0A3M7LCU2_9FLAO|nr:hypothetical protein [Chryseobacterium nematophagum]RMZ60049.1 hypothetical protein D1632_10685 [Chryseobacterium nematophagum]
MSDSYKHEEETPEREEVNRQGYEGGCHTCGTKIPGTKTGNFIPDHQPANALADGASQTLYPTVNHIVQVKEEHSVK